MRFLLVTAALAFLLRLAFGLLYWVDAPMTRDEREYLSLARSLAAGHGFVYDAEISKGPVEPFGRAPAYPALLAAIGAGRHVTTAVPVIVKIVQSIAGALGVLLAGGLAGKLAGVRAAKAAALLAAVYPPLVWIAAYALSEAVFFPVGLGVAWLFQWASDKRGPAARTAMVIVGLAAGVAVLLRAATTIFLALAGLWLLWRRRPGVLAALALGAAIVILPWTVRSTLHYGRLVLVATEGGVTFWTGNNALARGEGDLAANPELKRASDALKAEQHPALSEEQMEPVYYRDALTWMRSHPLDWLSLEGRKLFYLIVPIGPSYRAHSNRYYWASVLSYGCVLPLAIIGFIRLGARRSRTPGLWLLAASAAAVCLVFFPQERFRMPIIDSALVICAGVAVGGWRERLLQS